MKKATSRSGETVVWRGKDLTKELATKRCETCGVYFAGPAPIQRGPAGRTMIVCESCKCTEAVPMLTIIPVTRREQAEAYADLYDVPLADLYRRYGAVLLRPASLCTRNSGEVGRGR